MPPEVANSDLEKRRQIFRALVQHFGQALPASFFQRTDTAIQGVERIHNLIEGIYKPAWSNYALSIASMLKSRYSDEVFYNSDRTWWINYSPKAGGMDLAVNTALIRCISDKQPVLVLRQESNKTSPDGARYRLLGLGAVEDFDVANDLFRIRGWDWSGVSQFLGIDLDDKLIETALRLESLEKWTPFVQEDRAVYRVSPQKRDAAFRGIVLSNYENTCAVTRLRFQTTKNVEADGAHIIRKDVRGTDDPRNGMALSKSVHWAFDRGIFTISDQYEVLIHPKARDANVANFPLMEMNRRNILLPADEHYRPHPEALAWHRKEVYDRFVL
jgi:HNH endonuclease